MADMVNHPSHYETGKYECIDVMLETQGKEAVQKKYKVEAMLDDIEVKSRQRILKRKGRKI